MISLFPNKSINGLTAHVKDTPRGIDAIAGAAEIVQMFRELQNQFDNFGRDMGRYPLN